MRNLADTVARLQARPTGQPAAPATRLKAAPLPTSNPGALMAWRHVPLARPERPALVVVLHGCTQTAAEYDQGSGWSDLADRHGFVVLYPEQQRANNPSLCFNWFSAGDTARGLGEAASIRGVIARTVEDCDIDPARIFVTGLSAGGAMASTMLAAYPEVFAGGAIIAGLAHGTARTMPEAFDRMRGHGLPGEAAATAAVLTASGHEGAWPEVTVFHGQADRTVVAANADAILGQWRGVHDLVRAPDETRQIGSHHHRLWRRNGRIVLEDYRLTGMGHGVPLSTDECGKAGPFMLDVGLSSTRLLAERWGLAPAVSRKPGPDLYPGVVRSGHGHDVRPPTRSPSGVQALIEGALRTAGLMK